LCLFSCLDGVIIRAGGLYVNNFLGGRPKKVFHMEEVKKT
jgi:hypothetical protein